MISVIIAAGRPNINETLESVIEQTIPRKNYEIIVVSERAELESSIKPPMIFVKTQTANPAIKRNKGVLSSNGNILAFIDDDAIAPYNWLEQGRRVLINNPDYCGAGGPNLLPVNASRGERLTDLVLNFPLLGSGHTGYSSESGTRKAKLGEIHLCNLFVFKSIFEIVGGFNEYIGYGGEDTEFVYQAKKRTRKDFLYSSDVFVRHHRRQFGWAYIKQRFKLRTNNGRLTLAYPALYTRNLMFSMIITAICAFFLALVIDPVIIPVALLIYIVPVSVYVIVKHRDFFPVLVLALLAHHISYAAGIFYGLLAGAVEFKKTLRIRR